MTPRTVVVLAAALLAFAAGCSTTGGDEPTRSSAQQGYVGVGSNLTRIPPDQRRPAPRFSGALLGSTATWDSAGHTGKVLVINVWGSWCAPCRKEAPDLQAASEQTKTTAQFIGITTRDVQPAAAEAFVRAQGITYPSIFDPSGQTLLAFAGQFPPSAIPTTLIIDAQGRLAARALGPVTKLSLVQLVDEIAAGK